jgi:hypothetical protein
MEVIHATFSGRRPVHRGLAFPIFQRPHAVHRGLIASALQAAFMLVLIPMLSCQY